MWLIYTATMLGVLLLAGLTLAIWVRPADQTPPSGRSADV
jgi:hypothetical protein